MSDNTPAARCPVPACPVVYKHGGPRLCASHRDDGPYATFSTHRSPWQDRPEPTEPQDTGHGR